VERPLMQAPEGHDMTTTLQAFQVTLTGTRLKDISDAELIARLQAKLKLTPQQAQSLLRGRLTVKRGIDLAAAQRLVGVFTQIGLKAAIENTLAPKADTPPPPATQLRDPLAALRSLAAKNLPKPRTSPGYLLGLLLVTLLCVAMPAIYMCFTAGIAAGWIWYLTHIHEHLPRSIHLIILTYAVPGLAGGVLLLFLFRPIFARSPRASETVIIDAAKEPGIVDGVRALCRAIGVSPPSEIHVSWDANASVHFRDGWRGLLTGRKVLTIGMSLVAGLNAQQFVGVLAHEFGHFAQRFGMTCSYIMNTVNAWLEHCAHGEDEWEQRMRRWSDAASEKEDGAFTWLVSWCSVATLLAIAGTRLLMSGLFQISFRLTQHMSRQMEFDADRYEALFAGSDTFRVTARNLRGLNEAFDEINRKNIAAWRENRLLRDMPSAVATHFAAFGSERLAEIEDGLQEATTTRYWDSHPPDTARIDNAERQRSPGLYRETAPASLMFRDFGGWCERATRLFYREQGVEIEEGMLRTEAEVLGLVSGREGQRDQLLRFFNGQFQPWPLLSLAEPAANPNLPQDWQTTIDQIRTRSPELTRAWLKANSAEESRPLLRIATTLNLSSQDVSLAGPSRTSEQLGRELELVAARRLDCHRLLIERHGLYALRIKHAIASMPAADHGKACAARSVLIALSSLEREVAAMEEFVGAITMHQNALEEGEPDQLSDGWMLKVAELAAHVLAKADRIPQTITVGGTIGGYLRSRCSSLPPSNSKWEPKRLAEAAWPLPDAFHQFYMLALGELLSLCESAEKAQGIRPIRLVA
jgi:Zn-dependent protease with chaperone function